MEKENNEASGHIPFSWLNELPVAEAATNGSLIPLCPPHHKVTVRSFNPEAVLACSFLSPLLWALVELMHSEGCLST